MIGTTFAKIRGPVHRTLWQTTSINDPHAKSWGPHRRKTRCRTKTGKALWNLAHLWKSIIGRLRLLLLDHFHRCLEKSLVKDTRPFPQLHTAPTMIHLIYGRKNVLLG